MQTPYSRVGEAQKTRGWHTDAMKTLLTAVIVLLGGAMLIHTVPGTELVPTSVRAVLDQIASIW